ncbi:SWI SNF, matrix associated, actin dependent regulator of chromatin, sub c, member 2, partial [Bulinus truncatus]
IRDVGDPDKGGRSRKGGSGKNKTPKGKRSPSPSHEKMKRKSSRTAAIIASKKKRWEEEDEDSTKDMDDIQTENNVHIVHNPKPGVIPKGGKDEFTPLKGGTVIDLDEKQAEIKPAQISTEQEKQDNGEKDEEERRGIQDAGDDNLTEQTHHIIVPNYSAWFDYNSVHAIERRALPEFFNGKNKSKSPEVYLAYRNFMIDTYRLNPTEYLTSTAVRRNLAGDVCCIIRVHAFLEQWGLLNYQVDSESHPSAIGPPTTSHFHILSDAPSGITTSNPAKVSQASSAQEICEFNDNKVKEKEETKQDLGTVGLKTDIYGKKSLKDKNSSARVREWTDQETLLLLEALELYKDDWNKVCEHVGSRTQDECILHFLRLPIEDPYLDSNDNLGPLAYQPIPFSKSGNPIMSTVAFLASVVDPRVASAAAKAALEEFSKIKDEIPLSNLDPNIKLLVDSSNSAKIAEVSEIPAVLANGDKDKIQDGEKKSQDQGEEEPMEEDVINEKDHKIKGKDRTKEKKERKKSKNEEITKEAESKATEDISKQDRVDKEKEVKPVATEEERLNDASVIATAAAAALASAAVKAKLASIDETAVLNLWVLAEVAAPDTAGSETDLGLAPGGKMKLLRSSSVTISNPNKFLSQELKALDLRFNPLDLNHFYVATDAGCIVHRVRFGSRVYPQFYSSLVDSPVPIVSVDFSPFGQPYFLAACQDGSLQMYQTKIDKPIATWRDFTSGTSIISVRWSQSRPAVFFVLDSSSAVYTFDLVENGLAPVKMDRLTLARVNCIEIASDPNLLSPGGVSRPTYMACATYTGEIELLSFNEEIQLQQPLEEEFLENYVDRF